MLHAREIAEEIAATYIVYAAMAAAKRSPGVLIRSGIPDQEKEAAKKERYYGSQKELLKSLSELRSRIHCDRQLAERDNFLKRASQQVNQCKSILQEKWSDSMKSMKKGAAQGGAIVHIQ